ncbi:hypothetical protein Poli38472_014780 [Pythium oligandrum]|uniref:glucan endo-1,3-beta-D-glucosidase n=1 Tax=Pythium oligandrum TaxID=41045 RepID=A0A8K1C241_PYTOL|nr:hypothetical protein Poli38472_014780 [Pythium oligandrum]|eukprot:TMW55009.1 hypothetical protein Poli38472_014780 [Pythium oligandrum]
MVKLYTLVLVSALAVSSATKINFVNKCSHEVDLQHSQLATTFKSIAKIAPGATFSHDANGAAHAYRHGSSNAATMAEFSIPSGQPWYDISIIPPMPGNCNSYSNCKAVTKSVGFNVAMNIVPKSNDNGANCRTLKCPSDDPSACSDAYHFPDDVKTHDCPAGTEFDVVFCPNGNAVSASNPEPTPVPTLAPAPVVNPAPVVTPAPVNQSPPTQAPASDAYQPGVVSSGDSTVASDAEVTAVSSGTIKGTYSYKGKYAGNVAGSYDRVTSLNNCQKTKVNVNNPIGPMSEGVSMVFRGPMNIHNVAVFQQTNNKWSRVSSFAQGGNTENMVFMNNKNIDYSGQGKHGPQGLASTDGLSVASKVEQFSGKLIEAKESANIYGGPGIASGAEVNILTGDKCNGQCLGYSGDNDYKGWSGGKKIFVTKVQMPQGTSPNQPAIWMLNDQVVHSNQYGCNCRGMGAAGGCGELDIAEVIETNAARDRVSAHYYFYDGTLNAPNGDNWGARPTNAPTVYVTVMDDSGEGLIKILELSDFDFNSKTISNDLYQQWLKA